MKWTAEVRCVKCREMLLWDCVEYPGTYEIQPESEAHPKEPHGCEWTDAQFSRMEDAALMAKHAV
jgi:hypothetical protein